MMATRRRIVLDDRKFVSMSELPAYFDKLDDEQFHKGFGAALTEALMAEWSLKHLALAIGYQRRRYSRMLRLKLRATT